MKKIKIIIFALVTVLVLAILLQLCTLLLVPKYMNGVLEGALTAEYYNETDAGNTHKVMFVGDCEVYESFVPPVMWEKYGVSSYIRGSAQQLIWQSYYLLEETFEYESPQVVVFNVLSMKYGEPQKEEYNRMTLDGMRSSKIKHKAILASMTEEENIASYYVPILRYHSRWKDIDSNDFKYMFDRDRVSHNGYLMQTNIKPMTVDFATQEENAINNVVYNDKLPGTSFEYLATMKALCEENGAELVLIKSPTNSEKYWWYDEWDAQIKEYASEHGLDYYNFTEDENVGIDWQTDTYDAGLHLNVYGAEKFTEYFGKILVENYGLTSETDNEQKSSVWNKKIKSYYNEKEKRENND